MIFQISYPVTFLHVYIHFIISRLTLEYEIPYASPAMENQAISTSSRVPPQLKRFAFTPGHPGGGRPKSALFRKRLLKDLLTHVDGERDRADLVAAALGDQAIKGNVHAFEALRDTVDGKPGQDVAAAGGVTIVLANDVAAFAAEAFADELEE